MAGERQGTIVFVVSGTASTTGATTRSRRDDGGRESADELFGGTVKQAAVLVTTRDGAADAVRLEAVPGEDVVVLDIADGPSLVLHPENARVLMAGQAVEPTRSVRERMSASDVFVPRELQWRRALPEQDRQDAAPASTTRGATRGIIGKVILRAIRIVTGIGKGKLADLAADRLVAHFDERVKEGVYELRPDRLGALRERPPVTDIRSAPKPILVLVHGTFSSTEGTFSKFWIEHPDLVRRLFHHYESRVYALDHRTLGVSPIANALTLARTLPAGARLHLLTHSRGGLVAETLVRAMAGLGEADSIFDGAPYAEQRRQLAELVRIVTEKEIVVERVVRVACPARGTLLASHRLDAYLSVLRWALSLVKLPGVGEIGEFLGEVARRRLDPLVIPGLAAQVPDSPLVRWLHAPSERPLPGELRVVAGDMDGDSIMSWLKTLVADSFYWTDNDLVVQTSSMYGGGARERTATFLLDQGGKVTHFAYFSNERTARAIVSALTEVTPRDFSQIGPLSALGKDASGVRGASRQVPKTTGERPAVFLLPGILGSNLRDARDRVWLGWPLVGGLDRLALGKDVDPDGAMEPFYARLVAYLQQTHDVFEFDYDWRVPLEQEAKRLGERIEVALGERQRFADERTRQARARAKPGERDKVEAVAPQPVRIIAHSMGGLLARTMWLERPDVWERMMENEQARFLMLGTPNAGSWAPMQVLSGDDSFGNLLSVVGAPFRQHASRTIMASFPGFLQLQAGLLDQRLDLDEVATWQQIADADFRAVQKAHWWHVLAIQKEAHRWGVPTAGALAHARALRERLDAQRDTELARYASNILLVVGRAPRTPDGFTVDRDSVVYRDAVDAGDGRVTHASAALPGVRTWQAPCDHGTLPRLSDAFAAYEELLSKGSTRRLPGMTASGLRGAADTVTHVLSRPSRERRTTEPPQRDDSLLSRPRDSARDTQPIRTAPLLVTVVNGDLTFINDPLLLGHYRSVRISGAELVLDGLLGGALQRALDVGIYPSETGDHKIFHNGHRHASNPWRPPRPEAVIIAGLGSEGELSARELVATVRQAVIAWAEWLGTRPDAGDADGFQLAATLIGSGGAGISAGQSAQLVAQGVHEANEKLAEGNWPRARALRLVELYLDRATEAWRALKEKQESAPAHFDVHEIVEQEAGGLRRPLSADYRGAPYDFMSVQSVSRSGSGAGLSYRLSTTRARNEVHDQQLQAALVRELVVSGSNDRSDDPRIGRSLFQLLVPLSVEPFLGDSTDMVIEVDGETAGIPWELLDTTAGGHGDPRPWAIRSRLLRKLRTDRFRLRPRDADLEASALVIGEPACDTARYPRLPGARAEAIAVQRTLTSSLQHLGAEVRGLISPMDDGMPGHDAKSIVETVLEQPWRIIHVSGHGEPPEGDDPRGVVLSNGTFLGPNEIESMREVPELVFVNCCHLAARDPDQLLGITPADRAQFAAGVAEALIRIGVRCVIAAGWAVEDAAAEAFATTFYECLGQGRRFIDAVDDARAAARRLGGNTWAAYQCYGDPDWRLRMDRANDGAVREPIRDDMAGIASPQALSYALQELAVRGRNHTPAERRDRDVPRIEHLEVRFADRWGSRYGYVAEAFGAAWQGADEPARAATWYEKAIAAADGTASIKATEQLANNLARAAWERVAEAHRTGRVPAADVQGARDDIARAIDMLRRRMGRSPTLEQRSLVGSAWKRLGMLEQLAGQPEAADRAMRQMRRHYMQAVRESRVAGANLFYPAANVVAADMVLGDDRERAEKRMALYRGMLRQQNRTSPDFWSAVAEVELQLFTAMSEGSLGDAATRREIIAAFKDVNTRDSTTVKWRSVYDQALLILGHDGGRVPALRAAAREVLEALRAWAHPADRAAAPLDGPPPAPRERPRRPGPGAKQPAGKGTKGARRKAAGKPARKSARKSARKATR